MEIEFFQPDFKDPSFIRRYGILRIAVRSAFIEKKLARHNFGQTDWFQTRFHYPNNGFQPILR